MASAKGMVLVWYNAEENVYSRGFDHIAKLLCRGLLVPLNWADTACVYAGVYMQGFYIFEGFYIFRVLRNCLHADMCACDTLASPMACIN